MVFRRIDDDGTGKISHKNVRRIAQELEMGFTDEDVRDCIETADTDGDGEVNIEEFYRTMSSNNMGNCEMLETVFRHIDDDGTGKISYRNLKRITEELNMDVADDTIDQIIDIVDVDGDGECNIDDFMPKATELQEARDREDFDMIVEQSPPGPPWKTRFTPLGKRRHEAWRKAEEERAMSRAMPAAGGDISENPMIKEHAHHHALFFCLPHCPSSTDSLLSGWG